MLGPALFSQCWFAVEAFREPPPSLAIFQMKLNWTDVQQRLPSLNYKHRPGSFLPQGTFYLLWNACRKPEAWPAQSHPQTKWQKSGTLSQHAALLPLAGCGVCLCCPGTGWHHAPRTLQSNCCNCVDAAGSPCFLQTGSSTAEFSREHKQLKPLVSCKELSPQNQPQQRGVRVECQSCCQTAQHSWSWHVPTPSR